MKTCAFITLGCKVNQYETQSIRESFARAGYREAEFKNPADVYIINSCTVTAKTDRESRRLIRDAQKRHPKARIIVTGCYAERNEDEIRDIPGVYLIIKNQDKGKIVDFLDSGATDVKHSTDKRFLPLTISDFKDRTKAFLKIQDGCNNFCSYCKVPLVRGRSRSRTVRPVVSEAKRLISRGFKEIVLTGICLGAWGDDFSKKQHLHELLGQLIGLGGDFRIRLSSIEPGYVTEPLTALIKSSAKLCKHLHIPLQSGDNRILKAMNRPYTAQAYLAIIEKVRKRIPDISITTDALVGFPGETEANFRNTLKLIEKVRPSRIHIFPYSRREGTAAAGLKKEVPKPIAKRRLGELNELSFKISLEYRKDFLQKETRVLIEHERDKESELLKGYDDKYIKMLLEGPDDFMSKIVPARIQRVEGGRTYGEILHIASHILT